jgi:hypothetical protein
VINNFITKFDEMLKEIPVLPSSHERLNVQRYQPNVTLVEEGSTTQLSNGSKISCSINRYHKVIQIDFSTIQ